LSDDHHKVEVDGPGLVRMVHKSTQALLVLGPRGRRRDRGGNDESEKRHPYLPVDLSLSLLSALLFVSGSPLVLVPIERPGPEDHRSQIADRPCMAAISGNRDQSIMIQSSRAPKEPVGGSSTQLGMTHVNNSNAMCTVRTTTS
jgi:hypothetical protein